MRWASNHILHSLLQETKAPVSPRHLLSQHESSPWHCSAVGSCHMSPPTNLTAWPVDGHWLARKRVLSKITQPCYWNRHNGYLVYLSLTHLAFFSSPWPDFQWSGSDFVSQMSVSGSRSRLLCKGRSARKWSWQQASYEAGLSPEGMVPGQEEQNRSGDCNQVKSAVQAIQTGP